LHEAVKMNLLALLTDGIGSGGGGIARYNRDLVIALAASRHVSRVVLLPRFADAGAATPAKVQQLAPCPGRSQWAARAITLAAWQRFDAVLCGHLNATPLAAAIAAGWRVPLWVQVHGIEAWERRGVLCRLGLSAATLVTAVSRYTRAQLLTWANLAPHRVRILPNTVDADYAARARPDDLIARYGLQGRRIILTVGRLSAQERYKGHDRVIAALPGILAHAPDVVYLIVGAGNDQSRLAHLAGKTGVATRVVFAGQVPDAEVADHFALAHVFAMPSTGEGFGIVYLEAAASGLPVIGGNADGSVDALADGRIGRLVDPLAVHEIEAAVVDALEGRHPVPDASEQAHRFAFPRFAAHVDALVASLAR
jgi:phosphatidylinositol alpha-1,6-mannosyltransferase